MQEYFDTNIPEIKDITFISHSYDYEPSEDTIKPHSDADRIHEKIKYLEELNAQLIEDINFIKQNPHSVGLDPLGTQLKTKIELLTKENIQLKQLIERNKDQTPAKKENLRESFSFKESLRQSLNTPRKHKKQFSKHTIEKSNTRMIRMSSNSILDQIDNNFYLQKAEVSTCQNYQMSYIKKDQESKFEDEEIQKLRPLTKEQNKIKNGIKTKVSVDAAKGELVSNQLKALISQQKTDKKQTRESIHPQQLQKLHQYKQKLIKKLKSASLKEQELKKILSQLDHLYTNSIQRYHQLQSILEEQLRNRENIQTNQADIIERYHEALRLQQILSSVSKEYQKIRKVDEAENEEQLSRLKSIKRQLVSIINKLRLKCEIQGLGLGESIEVLSMQILNNVYLPSCRSMSNISAKVNRIRQLCEQQKENNSKIIMQLKNRQQELGRELLQKQMSRSKRIA